MKTDRELLELAAKAAGLTVAASGPNGWMCRKPEDGCGEWLWWNPLCDDGDAFRLSYALGLVVDAYHDRVISGNRYYAGHRDWVYSEDSTVGDISVRRAIVRAAAAIGEQMQ